MKFNVQFAAFRRRHLSNHPVAEAVTLATLTAMISFFNRFLRIDMTESMSILFRECENGSDYDGLCQYVAIRPLCLALLKVSCRSSLQWPMANSLFLATVCRIGLVVISYGCKVPAGIFVPSMAIGATFGRMIGIMVKALWR